MLAAENLVVSTQQPAEPRNRGHIGVLCLGHSMVEIEMLHNACSALTGINILTGPCLRKKDPLASSTRWRGHTGGSVLAA